MVRGNMHVYIYRRVNLFVKLPNSCFARRTSSGLWPIFLLEEPNTRMLEMRLNLNLDLPTSPRGSLFRSPPPEVSSWPRWAWHVRNRLTLWRLWTSFPLRHSRFPFLTHYPRLRSYIFRTQRPKAFALKFRRCISSRSSRNSACAPRTRDLSGRRKTTEKALNFLFHFFNQDNIEKKKYYDNNNKNKQTALLRMQPIRSKGNAFWNQCLVVKLCADFESGSSAGTFVCSM